MPNQIGFNPAEVLTSAQNAGSGKGFGLGDRTTDHLGNEWVYVQASAAIPQYNIVTVQASCTATVFSSAFVAGTTRSALHYGIAASASIAADSYGWVMIKGRSSVIVIASSTGTLSGQLYAAPSAAGSGKVTVTASAAVKLSTLFVAATATTTTVASAVPVTFGYILTSA